ncbi:MAG: hypothetical protein RI985_28 [Chloroflexota bacterium]|jgi:hypothetical protein
MHDQPIQLDTSFDNMPRLRISSWLHTIDSRVVNGEPIVIVDDGSTQRVITAPCTGRIVDIYTEVGAHILPRTVLGMVRPDLIMPEPKQGLGSIITGILMIGLAVIAIPIIANVSPVSTPSQIPIAAPKETPQPTASDAVDEPSMDSPMPDAPSPGEPPSDDITNSADAPLEEQTDPSIVDESTAEGGDPTADGSTDSTDPNQFLEPTPSDVGDDTTTDPNTDIFDPNLPVDDASDDSQVSEDIVDTTTDQQSSGFMSNTAIIERFQKDIDRILTLTEEVEQNLPKGVITQSDYDDIVSNATTEVVSMVDALEAIITNNRDNTDVNAESQRWFSSFIDAKDDCLAIYATIQQSVNSQQPIPDLTSSYIQCYTMAETFESP